MEIRAGNARLSFAARFAARRSFESYTRIGAFPTDAARARDYSGCMTEKYLFADVDLPFHVWVKDGGRWVLRDAGAGAQGAGASLRAEPGISSSPRLDPQGS